MVQWQGYKKITSPCIAIVMYHYVWWLHQEANRGLVIISVEKMEPGPHRPTPQLVDVIHLSLAVRLLSAAKKCPGNGHKSVIEV